VASELIRSFLKAAPIKTLGKKACQEQDHNRQFRKKGKLETKELRSIK
jgi:hypothetical protein